ncbi:unnamed protein product [Spirodela intermedia]|uniref:PROP1-like PPR domain-containing protein n=1 Tax=Spirodela intermedia TaxID=51605 RepID=A0A7I8J228_SPIIN|nr:unnamed protein product [Spirodela intermedia]CAA6664275.1 unnamed protein product [Spirodela intermedia]
MLRELRFKWAHEKLEDFDFYRNLERIRQEHHRAEEIEKGENTTAGDVLSEGDRLEKRPSLTALPQRRGKIKYNIHGLDLSSQKWAEVADKIHDAEKLNASDEPQPIMGKCKLVTEEILSLKEEEDPSPLLAKWVELLQPKRVDWLALLDRIHQQNPRQHYWLCPIQVAERVLDEESFETAIGDYSKLMDAYAKINNVKDAERVLQKMTEKGINADIRVWVILLQMYCDAGILERAKEAFERLRSQGFQADLKTYRSMIVAYVNAGLPKAAEALIREMEARDIKPTLEMYTVLLQAFAQRGLVDSAQRMFNNMQFSGIQPDLEACTLLLEAYGHAGDPDQARHSFDFILKAGHKPDDRCVGSMIAAYEKKNLLDKALDLLLTMERDGFKPGIATYTVLVDWLGKLLLVDEVEQVLEKISELGGAPFRVNVSLCSMYARQGSRARP